VLLDDDNVCGRQYIKELYGYEEMKHQKIKSATTFKKYTLTKQLAKITQDYKLYKLRAWKNNKVSSRYHHMNKINDKCKSFSVFRL